MYMSMMRLNCLSLSNYFRPAYALHRGLVHSTQATLRDHDNLIPGMQAILAKVARHHLLLPIKDVKLLVHVDTYLSNLL